jgi:hypothetical protein
MNDPTKNSPKTSGLIGVVLGLALALGVFGTAAFVPPVGVADEVAALPSVPLSSIGDQISAQLNSAGNAVFASLRVSDASGIAITPADAGVMTTIAGSPVAAGETDGSGCITVDADTGLFTIASACGSGQVKLVACFGDVNAGNTAAVMTAAWSRTRSGSTSVVSHLIRKAEVVDAGTRSSEGCVEHIAAASVSDTYQVTAAVTVNGAAVTLRDGFFYVQKLAS